MNTWIKRGVLGDLTPITQKGLGKLIKLYHNNGLDFYITSVKEGNHSEGSFHYIGQAFDFRKQEVNINKIRGLLGPDWDVINEKTHFHAEYDPK